MFHQQLNQTSPSQADFPSLPPKRTISFILSFLAELLPLFGTDYLAAPNVSQLEYEDKISEKLLFFLNSKAKPTDLLFHFAASQGVDFIIKVQPIRIGAAPIFVIEAKRLPPTSPNDYVKGRTGGIERFKQEHAGFDYPLQVSAMLGYIQERDFAHWYQKINNWITALIEQPAQNSTYNWASQDLLRPFSPGADDMIRYISTHARKSLAPLELHHFWLNLVVEK